MKSLLYPAFDRVEMADLPKPSPAPGEVLLQVAACGICGSELEGFRKRSPRRVPPIVMGHEFCGVVAELGAGVSGYEVGQNVISNSLVPCGDCVRCLRGDTHLCAQRQIFGMHRQGAFAEYVSVPAQCLISWPENLPARAACLAEPLANGVHVANLVRYRGARNALVIGAGPIGLMAQQALQTMLGISVIVADRDAGRLALAQRLGSPRTIQSGVEELVPAIHSLTEQEGVDVVVDAVGAAETKRLSLAATRPGGAAVWIGLHENTMPLDTYEITLPERAVLGTYAATLPELQLAVDLMARHAVDVESWTTLLPLEQGVEGWQKALAAQEVKVVLTP